MNVLYTVLLCAAFAVIEFLIGGTRLLFSLPAYLVLATAGILSLASLKRPRSLPNPWCLAVTLLFLGYILIRALVSPVAYIAWPDEFMVLGALAVYFLVACYVTDPQRRLRVLGFLLALGVANLAIGVHQFSRGDNFMLFGFLRSEQYAGRASGFYVCPDHLAFFLEVVGCLSLSAALWGRVRLWVRLLFGYGALVLFGGLLLTASRGGFLSAAGGLSVLAVLGLWRLRGSAPHLLPRALGVILVALVLAAFGVRAAVSRSQLLKGRASDLVSTNDIRPKLWRTALAQFHLSPVFGTGAATYVYYGRRLRDPSVQNDPIRSHNDYLELLAEYGIAGAAGLLLFLGVHAVAGGKAYRQLSRRATGADDLDEKDIGSNAAAWNIGALSAMAAIAAHSVVDFNLHIPANTLLAAFVFGLLANPGRSLVESDPGSPARLGWPQLWPRLVLPVLGVLIFVTGAPRLPGEYYCEKARVALRDRQYLAASSLALKGIARELHNPQLFFYLGEARLGLAGDGPDTPLAHSFRLGANEAYERGLALAPCDTPLLLRHAQILTIFGDFPAAERVFGEALVWDPNSALVQTYHGFFLQRSGRPAEAKQAYLRAQQLAPNSAAASGLDQLSKLGLGVN